jgi:hypothetical protein
VAQVFQERAGDVRSVVGSILDDALDLDAPAATRRAARTALLPWLDQALGRPKESVEVTLPQTVEEIESMDMTALLAARDALRKERPGPARPRPEGGLPHLPRAQGWGLGLRSTMPPRSAPAA